MSVYNRKLFFNRGGQVNARGTGITSGLAQPVQKFQTGGQVDPMNQYRQAVYAGLMSGKSKSPGPVGSFLDVLGQSLGAANPLLPKAKDIKDRKIIKGADEYQYYADTGERVLPNVVKQNERKSGEKYNTFLDLQSTGYAGTFEDYLKSTEVIKPEKKIKHFWAVNKETGNDMRITDDEFDSATMEKGGPDRQGEGDKFIDAYDEKLKKMIRVTNDEFDSSFMRRNPPKMEANDKYTNNYKDYLQSLPEGTEGTGTGFVEFLDRNEKTQVTKGPTSYEEYSRTTEDPTQEGYLEFLEKFKLSQPKKYQEYLLTDDTPTTEEFGEYMDSQKKSGFTTDYKNYLRTLDDPDKGTGQGFSDFLDKQLQKTQADKDYWVWNKNDGDWELIKGSEFDSTKHSKEPLNQAMFLTNDTEFSELVENMMTMKKDQLQKQIDPDTGVLYTNAKINEMLAKETMKLAEQRVEALASEQPNVLSPEDELKKERNILKAKRDDKNIIKWTDRTNSRGENAGTKLSQFQMLGMAKEDAIIGKVFQPQREYAAAILNFLGLDDQDTFEKLGPGMKTMVTSLRKFIGEGNIASTDVVRALTALGTLANAENGALPGNLNQKEFQELKDSYATLFNSKEGFGLIIDLYQRDAQIDQLRYEAWQNHSLGKKLEGRLFGDESFENLSDGEAILKIRNKINALRDGMITGNEEMGWSDLQEQFDSVKSKSSLVSDWGGVNKISSGAINIKGETQSIDINMEAAEIDGRVEFLGYSDQDGNFTYNTNSGPQTTKIQAGPNVPVYRIDTDTVDGNGFINFIIKGFKVRKK